MATPFLVPGPPRSLCSYFTGRGYGLRNRLKQYKASSLGIQDSCLCRSNSRVLVIHCLGSPHVSHWYGNSYQYFFPDNDNDYFYSLSDHFDLYFSLAMGGIHTI